LLIASSNRAARSYRLIGSACSRLHEELDEAHAYRTRQELPRRAATKSPEQVACPIHLLQNIPQQSLNDRPSSSTAWSSMRCTSRLSPSLCRAVTHSLKLRTWRRCSGSVPTT